MLRFLKRLLGIFSPRQEAFDPDEIVEEQWTAGFGAKRESRLRFTITSEISYRAYVRKIAYEKSAAVPALTLRILKTGCIAWSEDPVRRYRDLVLRGTLHLDTSGAYGAAGFMFRMVDDRTYYMVLVSSRGYFRMDLVRNGTPLALVGWTEAPGPAWEGETPPEFFDLEITAYGSRFLVSINGEWAAEINDGSLPEGRIAFCAASYEGGAQAEEEGAKPLAVEALLVKFSLDSRIMAVDEHYDEASLRAAPENRARLAETFAALGRTAPALVQLRRARENRADMGLAAPPRELLLEAKLALAAEQWNEAENCIEQGLGDPALAPEFRSLKANLLYTRGRYRELEALAAGASGDTFSDLAALYNLLGHAAFHRGDYAAAAEAYDRAFEAGPGNSKNGIAAKNAANARELMNDRAAALGRYIEAGRAFLEQNRYEELGLLIPKLKLLGPSRWEARALTGKWAFGIENWTEAEAELKMAEELRKQELSKPPPDPAVFYLQALLLIRKGSRKAALSLLKQAVRYAPDYPLFRFRLAENRFLLKEQGQTDGEDDKDADEAIEQDLEAALKIGREEGALYGWIHNFAAQLALARGDTARAERHIENAAQVLGEVPEIRVNRAVVYERNGRPGRAIDILASTPNEDPEGIMANCAGNILSRAGRFEEAGVHYKKALAAAPDNRQYRLNRAASLAELARYGEADEVLTGLEAGTSDPDVLQLIAFVAERKGEYRRAETALKEALALDPGHIPSLMHLGGKHASAGRWDEVRTIIAAMDALELNEAAVKKRDELCRRMEEATTRLVACASCGREWRVKQNPDPAPAIRLFAMPPDDLPAGTCPACGTSYCVGCRKDALDGEGRFVCPDCGAALKLSDAGLKALVYAWSEENVPQTPGGDARRKKKSQKNRW